MRISQIILPIIYLAMNVMCSCAFFLGIYNTQTDAQQGENYRIIYIHVPSAWICMFLYIVLTICSLVYLSNKNPFLAIFTKSISKIGTLFTGVTLITGCLWGYPMWGAFWVWDARLTSVLILFFIYIAHISILNSTEDVEKANKMAALLAIIGSINIPIIKYSVEWWTTLHQASSITQFKNTIHITMLIPLLIMFIGLILITGYVILCDVRREILMKKIENIRK